MLKFIAMAAIAAMTCSQVVSPGGSNTINGEDNVLLFSTANNMRGNRNRLSNSGYNRIVGDDNRFIRASRNKNFGD